jgi:hypothetical protein
MPGGVFFSNLFVYVRESNIRATVNVMAKILRTVDTNPG